MPARAARSDSVDVLDPNDALQGLTARQQVYVALRFSGLDKSAAYRQAGDCSGMSPHTVGQRALEMEKLPTVQAKMRELQVARDQVSTLSANLNRQWITQRIMVLADNADKDSTKLRALELLGKHVGIDLFRETTRIEKVERTAADIDRELEEQLKSMAKTIEGVANVTVTPSRRKPRK